MTKNMIKNNKSTIKNGLIASGRALGGMAGSQIGMPIMGEHVGEKVFANISRAIGSGDYEVMGARANSLFTGDARSSEKGVRITHREYITDIVSSGTGQFNIRGFDINPGESSTFPYLAPLANLFEEFTIHGMIFEYVSTSSNYAANTALGTLIASAEYNTSALPYTSKVQMENANNAIAARPDKNMMFGIECAEFPNRRYYVSTAATAATNINLTTPCTFYFADVLPANILPGTQLGELWVSYDISFYRPRPQSVSTLTRMVHCKYKFPTTKAVTDKAVVVTDAFSSGSVSFTTSGFKVAPVVSNSGITFSGVIGDTYMMYTAVRQNALAGTVSLKTASTELGPTFNTAAVTAANLLSTAASSYGQSIDALPLLTTGTQITDFGNIFTFRFTGNTNVTIDPFAAGANWFYTTTNNDAFLYGDVWIVYLGTNNSNVVY